MFSRIVALLIRYKNISFGSIPRLISIFYWPSVQILFWGFFTNYFYQINEFNIWSSLNVILSAVVLWDVLFRSQLGLSMSFFEELWSRNLPNLFITPIKDHEIIIGLLLEAIYSISGISVISKDAILYAGTPHSSRKSTADSSKGDVKSTMPSSFASFIRGLVHSHGVLFFSYNACSVSPFHNSTLAPLI